MTAGHVPTTNLNTFYTNTTSGTPASPTAIDAAVQDIVQSVNDNYDYAAGLVNAGTLSNMGVINVKDYGAKGDGTTDDTAAIQEAIDSMTYADNPTSIPQMGILFFPKGKYIISSSLNIKGSIIVTGSGRDTTIISISSSVDAFTALENTGANAGTSITIQDLQISSSLASATAGAAINIGYSFTTNSPINVNILRVDIYETYNGIALGNVISGCIDNALIQLCKNVGIITSGSMNAFSIRNTYVNRSGSHGYDFLGNYCSFFNTASDSNGGDGYHFHINGSSVPSHITMISVGAESNTGSGIHFEGGQDISILNCFLNPTGDHPIVLTNVTGFTMTGYDLMTSTAAKYGISQTGCNRLVLINGYANCPNGISNDLTTCTVIGYGSNNSPGIGLGQIPAGIPFAATLAGQDHFLKMTRSGVGTYYLDLNSAGTWGVNIGASNTPFQIMNDALNESIRIYGGGVYMPYGYNLKSPNGTFYKVVVDNTGALSTVAGTPT